MPDGPPFRGLEWHDYLEKPPPSARAIYKGHLRVELWLRRRAAEIHLGRRVLEQLHRTWFSPVVPDFAGRLRGPPPGIPYNATFGRFRGAEYANVERECDVLFATLDRFIQQLDDLQAQMHRAQFIEEVLKVAAFAHCEVIRIHPFVNGNGRLARACINYFCARYGLVPVSTDRPPGEYLAATRTWLDRRNPDHFIDFLRPICKDA